MNVSGGYSKTLQEILFETFQDQEKSTKKISLEKIESLSVNDGYDKQGVLIQTSSAINSFNKPKITRKASRSPM